MIIRMAWPLANDHPDGLAFCKWSFWWTGLLQMIIEMDRPHANYHLDGPTSCEWSSGRTSLLQMVIQMGQPLVDDHQDGPASCRWSSGSTIFFSIFFVILSQIYHFPQTNTMFSFKTFQFLPQILGSRLNLADLSRTTCSCYPHEGTLEMCIAPCYQGLWNALR